MTEPTEPTENTENTEHSENTGNWAKPADVVGRDREWRLLTSLLHDPSPGMRLAIVSGRRRHGKSYLLQALTEAAGGLYVTAVKEEGRILAQQRFARSIAGHAGVRADALRLGDWEDVLRSALDVVARRGAPRLLVIDELPYLLDHSPEIPGLLQLLYDETQRDRGAVPGARVVLCGSAMSVMHELLSGTQALRGRALIDLRLGPFDYRTSRAFWGIQDPQTAFSLHAVLGGAPGYRPLARPAPADGAAGFDAWVTGTLLEPGRASYTRTETEYLLREDPRISQRTLYYDVLTAVARGQHTPSKIGAALGRERGAVTHPLDVLESAGYLQRDADILRTRHPVITLTDPVIRFNQLITLPAAPQIEAGQAATAWANARHTFQSNILGPHFEQLARDWTLRHGPELLPDVLGGPLGTTEVPDPAAHTKHEVDILALRPGERPHSPRASIALLGEAKATVSRRGVKDLERLDHIRGLLTQQGHDASRAVLALFSLHGFHPDLPRLARRRGDVLLIDLPALYGTGPVIGGG
jgi:DNA-binding transcriptional ArsR family regulator